MSLVQNPLEAAFFRYADYYDAILIARLPFRSGLERKRVINRRWQDKMALRQRLVATFRAMDNASNG